MSNIVSINYELFSFFPEIKNQQYFQEYLNFLNNASLVNSAYMEKHHIVPKCYLKDLSKEDRDRNNIIVLSAKDHYIAHKLLYLSFQDYYMTDSFFRMTHSKNQNGNLDWIDESLYSKLREDYANQVSKFFKGKTTVYHPNDTKPFIRINKEEIIDYLNKGYFLGTSPIYRKRLSESHKGYRPTEEQKIKQGIATKGGIWVYTIIENKFIRKRLKPNEDIPEGYFIGMGWNIENPKSNAFTSNIGKHWYNNGTIQKLAYSCPNGFKSGKLKK